jgi:dienelactone hydrolase
MVAGSPDAGASSAIPASTMSVLPALRAVLLGVASLALLRASGAEFDLHRVTPVRADQPIPMADFFRPSLLQRPKINSTGTHVAALISSGDDSYRLLAVDLANQKLESVGGLGAEDVYDFHWLTERRLMFALSSRKLYGLGYHAAELGQFNRPFTLIQFAAAQLISVPRDDRAKPLFWTRDMESSKDAGVVAIDSNNKSGVFRNLGAAAAYWGDVVDVREQNQRLTARTYPLPKTGMGAGYLADRDGKLAFAYTQQDGRFSLHRWVGGGWEACPLDLEQFEVVGVGEKPGELVVLDERVPGKPRALRFLDAVTGVPGDVLLEDPAYDFTGWLYRDPVSRAIVGAIYDRHGPNVVWFNDAYRALQKALNGMFPGQVVRLLGSDDAGRIFLVETFSDRQPATYHWVNLETKTGGLIKNSRPWIDPQRMQAMVPLKYKTRDGLTFDAYLTMPAGASKEQPPPLIVLPHGGPWVRDTWGFDGEVQYLASRGYAVLQPNYRGSTGYSWMYSDEDDWAFRKMHEDVTDCVRLIARSGHVDPKRVAIMGGSFGGYLALCGVTLEPELYRCAVTIAGVFDWGTMIKNSKYSQYDNPRYARLRRKLGDPKQETEKFEAISPLRHVAGIRVPVLVSHGKEDQVVEVGESRRLVRELEKHRIVHESHFVREEGHGMAHLKNKVDLYTRIDAFLERHLR